MSGKFLPYKYYGAEQGVPEYGFKGSERGRAGHGPIGKTIQRTYFAKTLR